MADPDEASGDAENAFPPKNLCLGRFRKCSQVDRAGSTSHRNELSELL
jgi:hypothetical protein